MFMKFSLALIVPFLNLGAYAPQITQHVNADYASSTAFIIIGRHSPQGSLFMLAWGIIASYCCGSLIVVPARPWRTKETAIKLYLPHGLERLRPDQCSLTVDLKAESVPD
jgi:hypothetical protein